MNFGTVQFKSFDKVEKLITKINFNHPYLLPYLKIKSKNFQYPKTNASFTLSSSGPAALSNDDQSAFLTSISDSISSVYLFSTYKQGKFKFSAVTTNRSLFLQNGSEQS
jgi:hypothetical protein